MMIVWLLDFLLALGCPVEFRNPGPLLMGIEQERVPLACVLVQHNPHPDLGALEYEPPFEPLRFGDVWPTHSIDLQDWAWFTVCLRGPGAECPRQARLIEGPGPWKPIACWLCDHDGDGDVDLADCARFQNALG